MQVLTQICLCGKRAVIQILKRDEDGVFHLTNPICPNCAQNHNANDNFEVVEIIFLEAN